VQVSGTEKQTEPLGLSEFLERFVCTRIVRYTLTIAIGDSTKRYAQKRFSIMMAAIMDFVNLQPVKCSEKNGTLNFFPSLWYFEAESGYRPKLFFTYKMHENDLYYIREGPTLERRALLVANSLV